MVLGVVLAAAAVFAASQALLGGHDPAPVEADLERLTSSDGLYTAPQIRAQGGYGLAETAYAYGALRLLGVRPRAAPVASAVISRLRRSDLDDAVAGAWYAFQLAESGAVPSGPRVDDVRRRWRDRIPPDAYDGLEHVAFLCDLSEAVDVRWRGLAASRRLAALEALRRTQTERDPAIQVLRARIFAYAGIRQDTAVQRTGRIKELPPGDAAPTAVRAAGVVEAAALSGQRPSPRMAETALRHARSADTTAAAYAVARAYRAANLDRAPLEPVRAAVTAQLGRAGAVPEQAVYPAIGKAAWLVVHIRRELGAEALPESRFVRLSQVMAQRVREQHVDPDDFGALLAAAHLAGLDYSGPGVNIAAPAPTARIDDPTSAALWSQRARVAADLGRAPLDVVIGDVTMKSDADQGAVGSALASAAATGTKVRAAPSLVPELAERARRTQFGSVRWAVQAAAGLAVNGRSAEAEDLLSRSVRVGCPMFPHLVRDRDGTCDLESTWLLLQMREALPTARRLTASMT